MEAKVIIVLRKDPFCIMPAKKPRLKRAGMVLRPKISITIAPQKGLNVLAAVTAKK